MVKIGKWWNEISRWWYYVERRNCGIIDVRHGMMMCCGGHISMYYPPLPNIQYLYIIQLFCLTISNITNSSHYIFISSYLVQPNFKTELKGLFSNKSKLNEKLPQNKWRLGHFQEHFNWLTELGQLARVILLLFLHLIYLLYIINNAPITSILYPTQLLPGRSTFLKVE